MMGSRCRIKKRPHEHRSWGLRSRATRIRTLKWRSQSPLPYHLAIALSAVNKSYYNRSAEKIKCFFQKVLKEYQESFCADWRRVAPMGCWQGWRNLRLSIRRKSKVSVFCSSVLKHFVLSRWVINYRLCSTALLKSFYTCFLVCFLNSWVNFLIYRKVFEE